MLNENSVFFETQFPKTCALIRDFKDIIARGQDDMDVFQSKLKQDPVYAFRWAEKHIATSVLCQRAQRIVSGFEEWYESYKIGALLPGQPNTDKEFIECICSELKDDIFRQAGRIPSSTSVMANLIENLERQATCRLYDIAKGY